MIKIKGDLELTVTTQVMLGRHVGNQLGRKTYCENIILELNTKLGGNDTKVAYFRDSQSRTPYIPFILKPHSILGADGTHPRPDGKTPSVAALLGSRYIEIFQYSAAISDQRSRQEVMTDLGNMFW